MDNIGRLLGYHNVLVLVDSGADITMLNEDLAPIFGIDLTGSPQVQVFGIGGGTFARRHDMLVRLCSSWVRIPVLFEKGRDVNLLGREGAFAALQIAFVHRHGLLVAAKQP